MPDRHVGNATEYQAVAHDPAVPGEPDVSVHPVDVDGNLSIELRGVDVYDPTTGQIRTSSTDDVACWFALAFPVAQFPADEAAGKIGTLAGSVVSAVLGSIVPASASRR